MESTLELIAVSIPQDHPTGTRRRGGFMFTTQPTVALVTPEQKAVIKADSYMRVHRRMSHAWFSAMGIERTAENEELFATEDPENWAENANIAPRVDGPEVDTAAAPVVSKDSLKDQKEELAEIAAQEETKKEPAQEGEEKKEEKKDKAINGSSSKKEVIAALVKKGKVAGKDFDPDASRNALLSVYNAE